MGQAADMAPRIAPLKPEDRDEQTQQLLTSLRLDPIADDLDIFATLAHHPRLLKRWSAFGGTLLFGGQLPARDRELLILRTAWLCKAEYEWGQHVVIGRAVGITDDEIERIPGPEISDEWGPREQALFRAVDELHEGSMISDSTWEVLAGEYDYQQLIEVCMVV